MTTEDDERAVTQLAEWWRDYLPTASLFAKRLSAHDTLAMGRRWGWYGTNIPKDVVSDCLPTLDTRDRNARFNLVIDSQDEPARHCRPRVVWYNVRSRGEVRLADLGDGSALLDPDNTGALTLFAFVAGTTGESMCRVWICRTLAEEEFVEGQLGPIEPDGPIYVRAAHGAPTRNPDLSSYLLQASRLSYGGVESPGAKAETDPPK